MSKTRILIADDYELVRRGVRHTLLTNPDWEIAAEASNGRQAVELCEQLQPDVIVLDQSMPGMSGLEVIRAVCRVSAKTRVLAFHDSEALIPEAMAAGARGYLLKSDAADELLQAVQILMDGGQYFPNANPSNRTEEGRRLTGREQEIVSLIANGKTNREIASLLKISIRTVETHRSNVMEKLGIRSVSDLILYAIRAGLREAARPGGSDEPGSLSQ